MGTIAIRQSLLGLRTARIQPFTRSLCLHQLSPSSRLLHQLRSASSTPTKTPSSTLAAEMLQVTSDLPPPPPNGRTGAKSKLDGKRPLSSTDRRRQLVTRVFGSLVFALTGIWAWSQGREWDNDTEKRMLGKGEDGTRLSRFQARIFDLFDYFNKPAWNPLLPPPLPEPHGRPYTLLVDLDDLLVHSSWDREHGWRTAKRPGVDYFLSYLSQLYEIVIFTTQPSYDCRTDMRKARPVWLQRAI